MVEWTCERAVLGRIARRAACREPKLAHLQRPIISSWRGCQLTDVTQARVCNALERRPESR